MGTRVGSQFPPDRPVTRADFRLAELGPQGSKRAFMASQRGKQNRVCVDERSLTTRPHGARHKGIHVSFHTLL